MRMDTQRLIENAVVVQPISRKAARLAAYLAADSVIANEDGHVREVDDAWIIYANRPEQSVKIKKNKLRPAINQMLSQMCEGRQRYWRRPSLLDIKRHVDEAAQEIEFASPPVSARDWEGDYERLEEMLADLNI